MGLTTLERLSFIQDIGVIAILRARRAEGLLAAADALLEGGVRAIEVTMTTAGALEVIALARRKRGDELLFGAGSVLDAETARAAILSGAQFLVAPTLKQETLVMGQRYGVPVIPGCYTPTECLTALEYGAQVLKLFPASIGGPAYVKALLAPLPQLQIIPVGGVGLENAAAYIRAGAVAVGVGSELVSQQLLDAGDLDTIRIRAAAFVEEIRKGRGARVTGEEARPARG
jgi:2-dehydro-3-deoxyphosphogluconate aldolase/(4S)-4-hydroxy-2-oxoglutarate aldolase